MKERWKAAVLAVLFTISLIVTVYPLISNKYMEKHRSLVYTEYTETVQEMENAEIVAELEKARDYNLFLNAEVSENTAFSQKTLDAANDEYYDILNIRGDGVMGYIEIPCIDIKLPIYHGTSEETLDVGVGHLLGSALPVGGEGNHVVLTGHSGLAGQKMFSDLEQMDKGELFFVSVLDQTLAYSVDEINIVLPEETEKLAAESGKDLCTLITCTPYGVNTHRLLVRGQRVDYDTAKDIMEETETQTDSSSSWTDQYIQGLVIGCVIIVLMLIIWAAFSQRGKESNALEK